MKAPAFPTLSSIPFYVAPLIFPMMIVLTWYHPWFRGGLWTFSAFFTAFVIVPVLDLLGGQDHYQPQSEAHVRALHEKSEFRYILYVWVPLEFALVLWACYLAGSGQLSFIEFVGMMLSVGLINGGGFTGA